MKAARRRNQEDRIPWAAGEGQEVPPEGRRRWGPPLQGKEQAFSSCGAQGGERHAGEKWEPAVSGRGWI